jgi:hypothetical protein
MSKVESLADAKKRIADRKYKDLVMQTFKDFEHRDKREQLEKRAAVEAAAKERL